MDQKTGAYRLDRKSKYRFYLRMFFDLIDCKLINSHIAYTKLGNDISLLNFNTVAMKALVGRCNNRKRLFPTSRTSKPKFLKPSIPREVPTHMPEFQDKWIRCHYFKNERSDHKIFVFCQTCGLSLCLTKKRNWSLSIICSFPSRPHYLFYTILKIDYLCANCFVSFIINTVFSV